MNILLTCCMGASTSIIAEKMMLEAKNQGKEYRVWAVDQSEVSGLIGSFDVLLLGPQVRHMQKKLEKIVGDNAPVGLMNPIDYGRCNVKAILEQAEKMYNNR